MLDASRYISRSLHRHRFRLRLQISENLHLRVPGAAFLRFFGGIKDRIPSKSLFLGTVRYWKRAAQGVEQNQAPWAASCISEFELQRELAWLSKVNSQLAWCWAPDIGEMSDDS